MATPDRSQVHIDNALTNVSIAYRNLNYIADRIFPSVPVQHLSNKFWIFTKADWYRDEAGIRAPGSESQEVDYTVSTSNYLCLEYAAAKVVPDETVANADTPLRPLVEATEFVTDKLNLRKEKDVADLAFGTGWSSSATPSTLWSNDTSDPIGDVSTGIDTVVQAIGRKPTRGVVGRGLWRHIMKHPDLLDRIKGAAGPGSPAILNQGVIAALFELEEINVGDAVIDSAAEGAAASRGYVWGNHLLIAYVSSTPSLLTPSAGYIFQFKSRQTNRFRLDTRHADKIEVLENWDSVVTAADAAYLIKSAA